MRNKERWLALIVLVPFSVWSTWVSIEHGYLTFFTAPWRHTVWAQEFLDLCIALSMVTAWLIRDARRRRMPAWPFVLGTLALGSVSPLFYLVVRRES